MQWTPTDAPLRIPDAATAPWTVAVGADDRQPRRPFSAPQTTVVVMLAAEPAHATSVAGVTMAASRGSQLVDVWQREASLRARRRGAAAQLEKSSSGSSAAAGLASNNLARAGASFFVSFSHAIECPAWTKNKFAFSIKGGLGPSTASLRLRAEVPADQRTLMAVPRSQ